MSNDGNEDEAAKAHEKQLEMREAVRARLDAHNGLSIELGRDEEGEFLDVAGVGILHASKGARLPELLRLLADVIVGAA